MLNLCNETIISFSDAARSVPGGVHRATVSRWAKVGVRGIYLEYAIIGGRTVTSQEAIHRFLTACFEQRWVGIANGHRYEHALADHERLFDVSHKSNVNLKKQRREGNNMKRPRSA